jgi:hypothetical protein
MTLTPTMSTVSTEALEHSFTPPAVEGQLCSSCRFWVRSTSAEHVHVTDNKSGASAWMPLEFIRKQAAQQLQVFDRTKAIVVVMGQCAEGPHWEQTPMKHWCHRWQQHMDS